MELQNILLFVEFPHAKDPLPSPLLALSPLLPLSPQMPMPALSLPCAPSLPCSCIAACTSAGPIRCSDSRPMPLVFPIGPVGPVAPIALPQCPDRPPPVAPSPLPFPQQPPSPGFSIAPFAALIHVPIPLVFPVGPVGPIAPIALPLPVPPSPIPKSPQQAPALGFPIAPFAVILLSPYSLISLFPLGSECDADQERVSPISACEGGGITR